jgi:hypothetical protein
MKTLIGLELESLDAAAREEYKQALLDWLFITRGDDRIRKELYSLLDFEYSRRRPVERRPIFPQEQAHPALEAITRI